MVGFQLLTTKVCFVLNCSVHLAYSTGTILQVKVHFNFDYIPGDKFLYNRHMMFSYKIDLYPCMNIKISSLEEITVPFRNYCTKPMTDVLYIQ